MKSLFAAACAAAAAVLGGCAMMQPPLVDVAPVPAALATPVATPMAPPPPVAGAIYQAAAYRPLFEDHRARLPGDTLKVVITERISASARSTSSVDKSGSVEAGITSLPWFGAASKLSRLNAEGSSSNTFAGKGATESTNAFSGTITAVVTGVLPNGHLLIAGEKQIGVNANVDVLRFSGQVDPRAIQPGNTVPSTQIANVRVEQRSQGQQADAQVIGWLARFFLNVLPI
jgi:flagellar L-ring protein precursor FlgH